MRIHAARACRAYPRLLDMLACGELHLSGVRLIAPVLTAENHVELLGVMRHRSKREIEALLAGRFPKQHVRAEMRRLPGPVAAPSTPAASLFQATAGGPGDGAEPAPNPISLSEGPPSSPVTVPGASVSFDSLRAQRSIVCHSEGIPGERSRAHVPGPCAGSRPVVAAMAPLREDRYKVQFTASQRLHDKIKQAQELLRNQVPDGDLAEICERALDLLIAERMKQRFAVGRKSAVAPVPAAGLAPTAQAVPSPMPGPRPNSRHIPNEVRRQVLARDGRRCTFVSELGRRCEARGGLEFHHKEPYARGGQATVTNVCLLCKAHNAWLAEREYGRGLMQRRVADAAKRRDSTRGLLQQSHGQPHGGTERLPIETALRDESVGVEL
jgi:hypothetical protein